MGVPSPCHPAHRQHANLHVGRLRPFGLRSGQAVERLPFHGTNDENTRWAWVSHAGGMGTTRRYLALVAPAGRNQFP